MNALETAGEFLAEAKHGIDTGTLTTSEIEDYIESARRIVDRSRHLVSMEAVQAAGKAALEELDHLEVVRRLLNYGIAMGRCGRDAIRLHDLISSRPQIDKRHGIQSATKAFTWLNQNRQEISALLSTIHPNSKL
jgi:hypothetical protein